MNSNFLNRTRNEPNHIVGFGNNFDDFDKAMDTGVYPKWAKTNGKTIGISQRIAKKQEE